ncbi:MAG: hypothetical protein K2N56_02745 [Oscillospiraceae bacterium]|nr:hypothetical protein [Oscillospiraceae bacterium]
MDCALWLNKRKIFTAAEISGNLDVASLRGYLLAGTLIEWLNEHGGKRYAARLSKLSPDDEHLNEKIAEIFGAKPSPFKELNGGSANAAADLPEAPDTNISSLYAFLSSYPIGSAGSYNYAALSSFGSFQGFFEFVESSGYSRFGSVSYSFGSYGQWEWLFRLLYGYGSFSANSFSFGSFSFGSLNQWEWEWLFRLLYSYGSFSANSFSFGSFGLERLLKMLFANRGSFGYGSFGSMGFPINLHADPNAAFLDEYDLIMLQTLASCPLDRFGYGIHNI